MINFSPKETEEIQNKIALKLLFGLNYDSSILRKHFWITMSSVMYCQKYLGQPTASFLQQHQVNLPEKSRADLKTLFLDLDETLIHCCLPSEQSQYILTYKDDAQRIIQEGIRVRPFLQEFLVELKKSYDIYIFSAAQYCYCSAIVNQVLDPNNQLISGILSREHCLQTKNGYFIKDLRIIANRDLNEMIIVDNLLHSFGFQINNGIQIMSWYGDSRDQELYFIGKYLNELQNKEISLANKEKFEFDKLLQLFMMIQSIN